MAAAIEDDVFLNLRLLLRVTSKIAIQNKRAVGRTLKAHVDRFQSYHPDVKFRLACLDGDRTTVYENLHNISGIIVDTNPER